MARYRDKPELPEGVAYVSGGGDVRDPDWRQKVNGAEEPYTDKQGWARRPPKTSRYMQRIEAEVKRIDEDPNMPDTRKLGLLGALEAMKSNRASVRAQGNKMYCDMVGYTTQEQQDQAREATLQALKAKADGDTKASG